MATYQRLTPIYLIALLLLCLSCRLNAFSFPASTANHDLRQRKAEAAYLHSGRAAGLDSHQPSSSTAVLSSLSGGGEEESLASKIQAFTEKNFFLLGMVVAVSCARLFPAVCVTLSSGRPPMLDLATVPLIC